jgi:hypothetical protein
LLAGFDNMDVVNVWTHAAVFGPSPYGLDWNGGSVNHNDVQVWDWMAKDWQQTGKNGFTFATDSGFCGEINWSINVMGMSIPTP